MKAVVCTRYGPPDVLQLREVPDPVPRSNDLLIRIHAAAVTPSDCYIRSAIPTARLWMRAMHRIAMGFTKPRQPILGALLAGEIEAIGKGVTRFRVGDRVWAFTLMRMGCYAQRIRVPQSIRHLTHAPINLSHDEAVAIPYGGLFALHNFRKAKAARGERVLVYGASGANGTCGVQMAKHLGMHVTAVCSTANVGLVQSLGADEVLDYTRVDSSGDRRFDVMYDAVGRRRTSALKEACRAALKPGGRYVSVDDMTPLFPREDFGRLKELAELGALKGVVDRRYPLEHAVDAHRYVEQGHKKGNVILTIGD
jgi:NADPH:quinone reductase-like Zn-dependent oxidoreductase